MTKKEEKKVEPEVEEYYDEAPELPEVKTEDVHEEAQGLGLELVLTQMTPAFLQHEEGVAPRFYRGVTFTASVTKEQWAQLEALLTPEDSLRIQLL